MKVGYARKSTRDQSLDGQMDALHAAGCERIFTDVASGAKADRSGLADAMSYIRPGSDTLVVYRLDRIARSLPHLIEIVADLQAKEVGFQSLTETIDTTSPGGRLLFHIMGAIGQFERDLIRERTHAGLMAAKARGRFGGRPKVMTETKLSAARKLLEEGMTMKDVASTIGVSIPTIYRWMPGASR